MGFLGAGSIPVKKGPGEANSREPRESVVSAAAAAEQPGPEPGTIPAPAPAAEETPQQRRRRLHRDRLAARILGNQPLRAVQAVEARTREALEAELAEAPRVEAARAREPGAEAPAAETASVELAPAGEARVQPIASPGDVAEVPTAEHQALWFALARRQLRSVALVTVEPGVAAGHLAVALGKVGRSLGDQPVAAIVVDHCDHGLVARTSGLLAATGELPIMPGAWPLEVIVAIPPVTAEPLGLAVAHAADAVILCIEMGRARLAATRETIELVGRDRIAGCVVIG